ncbi:MAG: rRNA maturation RNase YbeY [Pseudomonadota bacterium]|nr:rRNA maturation RNase YbeY [Pseudomonadota bacterium]
MSEARQWTSPANPEGAGLTIVLSVDDEAWDAAELGDLEVFVTETLQAAALHAGFEDGLSTEVSVTLTSDEDVREINREWRDKDRPTNVLSFPMMDLEPGDHPGPLLGDLVLAFETCAREADGEGKTFADHFRHLLVHGFLHCLGHDHVEDEDAEAMEALEVRILSAFSIADPYREDGSPESEETPGLGRRDDVSDTVER